MDFASFYLKNLPAFANLSQINEICTLLDKDLTATKHTEDASSIGVIGSAAA